MTLLADLEAFVRDHGSHGGVSGDATACDRSGVSSLFAPDVVPEQETIRMEPHEWVTTA